MNNPGTGDDRQPGWLPPRLTVALLFLGIAALTFWAYAPALNGSQLWDDDQHITRPELRDVEGLGRIWTDPHATEQYYPLSHSAFWVQSMLWGDQTLGFHVVNVALHILNALLVWIILRRLCVPGAFVAGALFVLHPVQVESVAWMTELKNTLSGFFYLAAMWAYLRFDPPRDEQAADPLKRRHWAWYGAALALFTCALLAKTVTASMPAAMLIIIWWKRGRVSFKRDVVPLIPFFVIGIVMGLVTVHFEREIWGSKGAKFDFSMPERVLIAGRAVWFYLWKLIWPTELAFFYTRWTIDAGQWWQYLYPAGAVALLATLWSMRHRIGRGPLAAALFFGGTLVPALGFFNLYWQLYTFACDHMQYLACIAVFAVAAACLVGVLKTLGTWGTPQGYIACAAIILLCAYLTHQQSRIYTGVETLWRDTLKKSPQMWMAYNNLGVHLANTQRVDEAIIQYHKALELNPESEHAHYNLGSVLLMKNDLNGAIGELKEAIRIRPGVPGPYGNLGVAYSKQGRLTEAEECLRKDLELAPEQPYQRISLASVLDQQGKTELALEECTRALTAKPDLVTKVNELGLALLKQGKAEQALAHFNLALRYKSDYFEADANRKWAEALIKQSQK